MAHSKYHMHLSNFVVFIGLWLFSTGSGWVHAQSYGTAMGLRFSNNNQYRMVGLTAQQRIMKGLTVEGILQSDFNANTTIHAILERHRRLVTKRFNYYYGAGLSLGIEESREKVPESMQIIHTYGNSTMGVDLIAGVEFTLLRINLSIDYKPNINIVGREPWYSGQVGISARSVLVKGSKQNKNKRKKARIKRRKNGNNNFFKRIIQKIKSN